MSFIPAVIGSVASNETSYLILSGNFFFSTSISVITCFARSTALDPGAWYNAITEHVSSFSLVIALYDSTPRSIVAISFSFTCEPSGVVLITISPNASGELNLSGSRTV